MTMAFFRDGKLALNLSEIEQVEFGTMPDFEQHVDDRAVVWLRSDAQRKRQVRLDGADARLLRDVLTRRQEVLRGAPAPPGAAAPPPGAGGGRVGLRGGGGGGGGAGPGGPPPPPRAGDGRLLAGGPRPVPIARRREWIKRNTTACWVTAPR